MSQRSRLQNRVTSYGKQLFMLTVEYIQRTEGDHKENKAKVFFDLDGKWKKICNEAKHKSKPEHLSPDTFKVQINDHKAMNGIRKDVFGLKPTLIQKFKALIQQED